MTVSLRNLLDLVVGAVQNLEIGQVLKQPRLESRDMIVGQVENDQTCEALEGSLSEAGVAVRPEQVAGQVHDDQSGQRMEQSGGQDRQLVVVQPQLLEARHTRKQGRGQSHDPVTREVEGLEVGEAGQRPVMDLGDLVVTEDEDLEAGDGVECRGRDTLQIIVGEIEAAEAGESEHINWFINILTDIDVGVDSAEFNWKQNAAPSNI